MNWTEGKLARHSRGGRHGNKQSELRQKEHFAKARAGQLPKTLTETPPLFSEFFQAPAAHRSSQPVSFPPPRASEVVTGSSRSKSTAAKRRRSSITSRDHVAVSTSATNVSHILPFPGQQHQPYTPVTYEDELRIHEKRRKLLRDHDWAGTSIQKPIPVQFGDSLNGRKWSKLSGGANFNRRAVLGHRTGQARQDAAPTTRDQGVKITLGSQQIRLGHPSSTIQSGTRSSQAPGFSMVSSILPGRSPSHRNVSHPGPYPYVESSSRVPYRDDNTGNSMLPPPKGHAPVNTVSDSSSSCHAEAVGQKCAALHAPVPLRRLVGLETMISGQAGPDAAGSTIAQVGMQTSPVPLDKKEENEAWRKWVAPTQATSGYTTDPSTAQPRVSPGISAWHHQEALSGVTQARAVLDVGAGTTTDSGTSSGYHSRHLDDLSSLPDYGAIETADSGYFHTINFPYSVNEHESGDVVNEDSPSSSFGNANQNDLVRPSQSSSSCSLGSCSSSRATDSPDYDISGIHERGLQIALQHLSRRSEAASYVTVGGDAHIDTGPGDQAHLTEHEQQQQQEDILPLQPNVAPEVEQHTDTDQRDQAHLFEQEQQEQEEDILPVQPEVAPEVVKHEDEDSNELWYKFVFSDNDTEDLHQQVLLQAQQDSTRAIKVRQPSEERTEADQSQWGYNISTAATEGLESVGPSEVRDDLASVPEACASHKAAFGTPDRAPVPSDASTIQGWEGSGGPLYAAPSTHAEVVSTSSSGSVPGGQGTEETEESLSTGSSMAPRNTDAASTTASIIAQPPESVANNAISKESFKFAPPKPFVGRFAEPTPTRYTNTAVKQVTINKPRRGRSKNRARDGRLDIKSVPRYEDDPIEDFDELGVEQRVQPSLFGALETETQ